MDVKKLLEKFLKIDKWKKLLGLLAFYGLKWLLGLVINVITVVQALVWFWTGKPLEKLVLFSGTLNAYLLQVVDFLTFRNESLPWPIGDLPKPGEQCYEEK